MVYLYFWPIEQYKLFTTVPVRLGEEVVYGDKGFVVTAKSSFQTSLSFIYFNRPFIEENAGLYWKITGWYFLGAMLITLMLHQVKQIMDSVGTVNVFSSANVFRIRLLGGLFLFDTVIDPLRWLWIKDDVIALLKKHYVAFEQGGYGLWGLLSASFFIGLLLFGLAEVFRSGLYLKEEQELTI
ncbi:DUF2975 domain-containing protein [Spirosoma fluviale]|nr:DUF2975 domain-containing protein [Spirosoma fluviale]